MTEILHVRDVTVRFGGVYAVQNVDLRINNGELIGFIGPNGAGKTTLMQVITGIVQPNSRIGGLPNILLRLITLNIMLREQLAHVMGLIFSDMFKRKHLSIHRLHQYSILIPNH